MGKKPPKDKNPNLTLVKGGKDSPPVVTPADKELIETTKDLDIQPMLTEKEAVNLRSNLPRFHKFPKHLLEKVKADSRGRRRSVLEVSWFFRYLETGDPVQAVVDCGWKGKYPKWKSWALRNLFAEELVMAVRHRRSWSEIKAIAVLDSAMELGLDPMFNKDPRVMGNAIKASGEILDRGDMPKGARIHGIDTAPLEAQAEQTSHEMLDRLVESVGIEAVRAMKGVGDYKAHRDYLDEKWPIKLLEN